MDLASAITLQRPGKAPLDLNGIRDASLVGSAPLSGYSVEAVNLSDVSVNAFTEDVPLVDGVDGYDAYLGGRNITMAVAVYGSTYGDYWDKLTALTEALQAQPKAADVSVYPALSADGLRKLSFTQKSAAGSDYSLYMMVRPINLPRFMTDKATASGVAERGYASVVDIGLFAEDPYKYYATESSFTRTGSGTISVVNRGTVAAWPTVTWANTSAATISATLGGETVSHSSVSTTVTDNFKTASSNNATTLTGYQFFSIPPGTSSVSVTAHSTATVTITIREAIL